MNWTLDNLRRIKHGFKPAINRRLNKFSERSVFVKSKGQVIAGPFSKTKLLDKQVFGSKTAKLLGTYEMELHDYFREALERQPEIVCNIGAAEGYYAMGFARMEGVNKVIVFEALPSGRKLIRENAKLNDVEKKIDLNGACDSNILEHTLTHNNVDLLLIDIEGAELDVLSSKIVSQLSKTELLIESHDFCRPNCLEILKSKFEATHNLKTISSVPRAATDFTVKSWLPKYLKKVLMNEHRPDDMSWLVCIPKTNRSTIDVTSQSNHLA